MSKLLQYASFGYEDRSSDMVNNVNMGSSSQNSVGHNYFGPNCSTNLVATPFTVNDPSWYLDSGAINHVVGDGEGLLQQFGYNETTSFLLEMDKVWTLLVLVYYSENRFSLSLSLSICLFSLGLVVSLFFIFSTMVSSEIFQAQFLHKICRSEGKSSILKGGNPICQQTPTKSRAPQTDANFTKSLPTVRSTSVREPTILIHF